MGESATRHFIIIRTKIDRYICIEKIASHWLSAQASRRHSSSSVFLFEVEFTVTFTTILGHAGKCPLVPLQVQLFLVRCWELCALFHLMFWQLECVNSLWVGLFA